MLKKPSEIFTNLSRRCTPLVAFACLCLPASIALSKQSDIQMYAPLSLEGTWVTERDGSTMLDPQSSGLIADENVWWTISDASAHSSQIKRLQQIDKSSKEVVKKLGPYILSQRVANSCFADYLMDEPDFEGMVFHPFKYDAWILVTEDATRGKAMSQKCQEQYKHTGSTDYPTLIVEVVYREEQLMVTGVRALQFAEADQVGNFPNDGMEGLALGKDHKLYMALEKDAQGQPRIFYADLRPDSFNTTEFISVKDANLKLPTFSEGNHPINGMDIYFPNADSDGFLLAAARNDNELWIIDIARKQPTVVVPLTFYAPSFNDSCPALHMMDNASLEGVAVDGQTLVLINDPWRKNYLKNAVCEGDKTLYERMSPLIFTTPINKAWFGSN